MEILMMGGTRFVGRPLVGHLLRAGHQVCLFTRGKQPLPDGVEHIRGDRSDAGGLAALKGRQFDVIVDSSGRTLADTQSVVCLLYTSPSPRDLSTSRMPSSA